MKIIGMLVVVVATLVTVNAVQKLHAAPTSRTVHVAVSPGGKITAVPGGLRGTLYHSYEPARITVKPGTTVVWTNKSALAEPHFVTFLQPDPQTGAMKGGPPWLIVRPKPGKEGSKNPLDADYLENPQYLFPSEMTGAAFRNSGMLWPARMGPPGAQSSWKTTFTAQDAGKTLKYTCVIHPWMTGEVIVTH